MLRLLLAKQCDTSGTVLRSGLHVHQINSLDLYFIDFIWRFLWSALRSGYHRCLSELGVFAQMGSLEWEGPDLGASKPDHCSLPRYDSSGTAMEPCCWPRFGLLLLVLAVLWIALEVPVSRRMEGILDLLGNRRRRGPHCCLERRAFSRCFPFRDDSGGTSADRDSCDARNCGSSLDCWRLWFAETLLICWRQSLLPLSAVIGCLRLAGRYSGFSSLGFCGRSARSESTEIVLAGLFAGFVILFWMVVHSYLVAVRYSAIDIMRRNVVGS